MNEGFLMSRGHLHLASALGAAVALAVFAPAALVGQAQKDTSSKTEAGKPWTAPRTASGQPDLQGVWANNMATPLQRPKELADKPVLNDQELTALKAKAARLFASGGGDAVFGDGLYTAVLAASDTFVSTDGKTGDYNQFWLVDREWEHRTSLITDPPDGRIPAMTPEAQKQQAAAAEYRRLHPADAAEEMPNSLRCLTYGVPRVGGLTAGYNSYYQIVQSADSVAFHAEMFHETRVIPLDARPHVDPSIRLLMGDSRGHWEGNTLVVDTTNFAHQTNYMGAHENLHVIERFTRVGPGALDYSATIEDPTTWTKPWTALVHLKQSPDKIYEFACHEGNIAMGGILGGARVEEKAAADDAKKGSR
jgi:hypothetical protein